MPLGQIASLSERAEKDVRKKNRMRDVNEAGEDNGMERRERDT